MPLSRKGEKVLRAMSSEYGPSGRRPVHNSPFRGKVTGRRGEPAGDGGDRAQADTLKQEVAGGLRSMRGLQARRAQLTSARQDYEPAGEAQAAMRGALGTMRASADVRRAAAAVHRQERVTRGQPLHDRRGRFIGNRKPD